MHPLPLSSVLSASEKLYRLMLFVYPPAYRREYGPLMIQACRDLCRNTYRQRKAVGLVSLWVRLLVDLVTSAARQHLDALPKGDGIMTKREHFLAIVAAALPLVLWLVLSVVNPLFVSRLFVDSSAQPWGWIMVAVVFILVGLAYLTQRKAFELAGQPDSSNRAIGRPFGRDVLRAVSIGLFVLPAIALVLLGPAIMTLLAADL